MDLPLSKSLVTALSRASLCPIASNCYLFRLDKNWRRWHCYSRPLRVELCLNQHSSLEKNQNLRNAREESKFVDVIGIGSRKDALLDFCLDSPLQAPALRFWNIIVKDSVNVQLQQRLLVKDITPNVVEDPSVLQSCSEALILVAGAAYGSEHIMALDILKTVKYANGLVVGIILKPFSFEGRRRGSEVKDLVDKLKDLTNFCIMVDTDALLEKDVVTLDEALNIANNAALMAMNSISILVSETHIKLLDVPNDTVKEQKVSELKKILGSYKDAKIGFGAGYNIKTSIARAIYDCPFLGVGIKDLSNVVICFVASSGAVDSSDLHDILQAFRQTTQYEGAIIISIVHEPNLEPNLIATTVIALGQESHETSHKGGIFSRLVRHIPFISNLLGKNQSQSLNMQENNLPRNGSFSEMIYSSDSDDMANMTSANGKAEDFGSYSAELQTLFSYNGDEIYSSRDNGSNLEQSDTEVSKSDLSMSYDPNTEGEPTFQRELLLSRQNIGPGYAQDWTSEEPNNAAASPVFDNVGIYKLPIGVKPLEELKEDFNTVRLPENAKIAEGALTDASYEPVTEFQSNAPVLFKGSNADASRKKQGNLSARAASMLEAERDSSKKWSPIVGIKYRGGSYLGRCQGGLPEGKGRLTLEDGSIYDGMWRNGKRSGLGTFCFRNGDIFRGSWRDDVMHGKGWLYFHTGDRWFANFWKGKANGEGRFYSRNGEVFFGHFKDGWRDGDFLCINVNGDRSIEEWDEGVLVNCKLLDSDAD